MARRRTSCHGGRMRPTASLVAALLLAMPALADSDGGVINLAVGQQKVIRVANVARVAIGEPEVADVKQVGGGGELLITGVGEGRTSLLVWRSSEPRLSYSVVVRRQDPKEVMSEVRALLGEREGVEVRVVGERVVLEGETMTTGDWDRVQQVVQLYPSVQSFVRPSGNARRLAAEALNRAYEKSGFPGVQAKVVGNTLMLEGSVESKEDLKALEAVTRAMGETADNLVTVGASRMVMVEVEFVEVATGNNKLVGVKPPSTLVSTGSGATATVSVVQPIAGLDGGQTAKIASLGLNASAATDFSVGARFDAGYVRVLSRP